MQVKKIDSKEVEKIVEKNYGSSLSLESFDAYVKREKVFLVTKGFPISLVEKSFYLLHFGTFKRNEKIHLSIEGTQMVGKTAKRNIVLLDEENSLRFLEGLNAVPMRLIDCEIGNFVLVKLGNDFLGSGVLREGYVESLVPKERRIVRSMKRV